MQAVLATDEFLVLDPSRGHAQTLPFSRVSCYGRGTVTVTLEGTRTIGVTVMTQTNRRIRQPRTPFHCWQVSIQSPIRAGHALVKMSVPGSQRRKKRPRLRPR